MTKQAVGEYASGAARVMGEQAVVAKDALNVHIGTAQAGAQMTKQVVGEYASGAAHVLGEHGVVAKAALSEHAVVAREALNVRIGTAQAGAKLWGEGASTAVLAKKAALDTALLDADF